MIRIDVKQKLAQVALDSLAQEFFPENPGKFIQEMVELIERCEGYDSPLELTYLFGRTAELFALVEDEKMIGVLLMKYFPWTLLAPQLYFVCQDGNIFLSPLSNLIVSNWGDVSPLIAAELSYFWVEPDRRGQDLGRLLFSKFHEHCQKVISIGGLAFTIAKSKSAKTKKGQELQYFLLQMEGEKNGFRLDGTSIVTGTVVPLGWALKQVGVEEEDFLVRPESYAIQVLAQEFGFRFLCFNKTLGSLYAMPKFCEGTVRMLK